MISTNPTSLNIILNVHEEITALCEDDLHMSFKSAHERAEKIKVLLDQYTEALKKEHKI